MPIHLVFAFIRIINESTFHFLALLLFVIFVCLAFAFTLDLGFTAAFLGAGVSFTGVYLTIYFFMGFIAGVAFLASFLIFLVFSDFFAFLPLAFDLEEDFLPYLVSYLMAADFLALFSFSSYFCFLFLSASSAFFCSL